ncbi:MAG: hypothetical protein QMD00_00285 [Hadesarchaea archaeon]|nr:hypothetical protein [Hadesarchaea archaeon]
MTENKTCGCFCPLIKDLHPKPGRVDKKVTKINQRIVGGTVVGKTKRWKAEERKSEKIKKK